MIIQKIGVIGAETMGSDVAQVAARNGFDVVVQDMNEELARAGFAKIKEKLEKEYCRMPAWSMKSGVRVPKRRSIPNFSEPEEFLMRKALDLKST